MSLKTFANSRGINHVTLEKTIWFENKTDISNSTINSYLLKISSLLDRINTVANQVIKLDNKPNKSRGLQKKIRKTIEKFQALNDQTSLVQIAMQNNIARVIGTSEKAQEVGTHAEFFEKVRQSAIDLKAAANDSKSRSNF